jgi:hypothetical protein
MSNKDLLKNIGKTPRQLADERERARVLAGNYTDTLSHLPQAEEQIKAPIYGVSPQYSYGEAVTNEIALSGNALKNHGGYQDGVPMKQVGGALYPDREGRAARALQKQLDAQKEAERMASNAGA